MSVWSLVYEGFDPAQEGLREALCTVGNGYFATRGAAPEARADEAHYPGTYVNGLYNRRSSEMGGHRIENEDLVNLPNWLPLQFRIGDGDWFHPGRADLRFYRQELDLRQGVLIRRLQVADAEGRLTTVTSRRFVSMVHRHVAGLDLTIRPDGHDARVQVRTALDGRVRNCGVPRYRDLPQVHLEPRSTDEVDDETISLCVRTNDSRIEVAQAARTRVSVDGAPRHPERQVQQEEGWIAQELAVELEAGQEARVEKLVTLYTSRDRAIYEPVIEARTQIAHVGGFDDELADHRLAWRRIWGRHHLRLEGDEEAERVLNLHVFHLIQTVSENAVDLDVGVPARGLHGEAYRGHVLWDELFALAYLNLRVPEVSRSLLRYRYRRLPAARRAAATAGHAGAMFPWQSGSNGREESQTLHLNPESGEWIPDNSQLQRHINIAVAYNVWQYVEATDDVEFLAAYGAEMLVEISRFLSSLATYDHVRDRYDICGVMGPDEFHDAYPPGHGRDDGRPGIDNNAYTNVMTVWVLRRTLEAMQRLPAHRRDELRARLKMGEDELTRWENLCRRMFVPFHDGVLSQFEGYESLAELDWSALQERHGDIMRLDRILGAEGDTPNRYKASKQADVLMLVYLLTAEELLGLLRGLGYDVGQDLIHDSVRYYLARTSHGSTLSGVVHSWVLARMDRSASLEFFRTALRSDIDDIQGGTTPEGIHLGAMAGTVDLVQRGYTGLQPRGDVLEIDPLLPRELPRLQFVVRYRRAWGVEFDIDHERVRVRTPAGTTMTVRYRDHDWTIAPGATVDIPLED